MISKADKNVDEYLKKMLKRHFDDGDKSVSLFAVYICLKLKRPIPEWLRVAFLHGYESAQRLKSDHGMKYLTRQSPGTHT